VKPTENPTSPALSSAVPLPLSREGTFFQVLFALGWQLTPHPCPSPARITGKRPQALMAGEGSIEERGLRPLS